MVCVITRQEMHVQAVRQMMRPLRIHQQNTDGAVMVQGLQLEQTLAHVQSLNLSTVYVTTQLRMPVVLVRQMMQLLRIHQQNTDGVVTVKMAVRIPVHVLWPSHHLARMDHLVPLLTVHVVCTMVKASLRRHLVQAAYV